MKWLDDPPDDWDQAPEEPPTEATESSPLRVERLIHGVVVRERDHPGAYMYTSDGAVSLADRA
ncbi:hypothetical protein BRD00_07895 [Halobacteriales archaeon QS_8_69_26]|nr:MAG: hypothetical protein BRD00_07895 [Halobacteriales archaeon QS_8_69_26]